MTERGQAHPTMTYPYGQDPRPGQTGDPMTDLDKAYAALKVSGASSRTYALLSIAGSLARIVELLEDDVERNDALVEWPQDAEANAIVDQAIADGTPPWEDADTIQTDVVR